MAAVDPNKFNGVTAAVATPLDKNGQPDIPAFFDHVKNLLDHGCVYASIFGTTGEAPSFSAQTRMSVLDKICDLGIDPEKLLPGTGAASLEDAAAITRHAMAAGVSGTLIFPPFYFPKPSLAGLADFFRPLGEIAGKYNVPIIFYNYPRMTKVPVTPELINLLRQEFGEIFAGVKDSSGDWAQTKAYLDIGDGFIVLPGSETVLPQAMPLGAKGTITGFANVAAAEIIAAYNEILAGKTNGPAQKLAFAINEVIKNHDLLPAQKYLLHKQTGNAAWSRLAPPLVALSEAKGEAFMRAYDEALGT